jgi:chromosome segregation ATPase
MLFSPITQELQSLQMQVSSLQATNTSLREEASESTQRWQRASKALQVAGSKASQARADADAAEATAANLVQTLQDLQLVVSETKKASQLLHDDHEELQQTANTIQTQLIAKEADISRYQSDLSGLKQRNQELETADLEWQSEKENLKYINKQNEDDLQSLRKQLEERKVVEEARQQRAEEVEKAWRTAQTLLKEATASQEQMQQTQNTLQETIKQLQDTNEQLHKQSEEDRKLACQDKERLSKALTKAEKDAQQLQIQNETLQEELQRHQQDAKTAEKQVSDLHMRLRDIERKLQDRVSSINAANSVSPDTAGDTASVASSYSTPSFRLPPLNPTALGSSRSSDASLSSSALAVGASDAPDASTLGPCCCLCMKAPIGIMKRCQCGQKSCDKRAHVACANKVLSAMPGPSVSHPGTPAPRLPLVLCSSLATLLTKS